MIAVGTDVTIEVELRRSVNTPTVVVVLVHRAGRVHTVTMNVEAAHNLGAAIDEAVRHLRPVGG